MTALPPQLRVGDSYSIALDLPAHAGRVVRIVLVGPQNIEIAAVESTSTPGKFSAPFPSSVTSAFSPGSYFYAVMSYAGTDRLTIETGQVQILPDITAVATPLDARTHARKMLDAIEALLEGRIVKDAESYQIRGRQLTRIPVGELMVLRDKFRAEAQREDIAAGLIPRPRRTIKPVFVR